MPALTTLATGQGSTVNPDGVPCTKEVREMFLQLSHWEIDGADCKSKEEGKAKQGKASQCRTKQGTGLSG